MLRSSTAPTKLPRFRVPRKRVVAEGDVEGVREGGEVSFPLSHSEGGAIGGVAIGNRRGGTNDRAPRDLQEEGEGNKRTRDYRLPSKRPRFEAMRSPRTGHCRSHGSLSGLAKF